MNAEPPSLADSAPAADRRGHQWTARAPILAPDRGGRSSRHLRAHVCMALWVASQFSSATACPSTYVAQWMRAGNFHVDFAFYLDQLSLVMLLVVTGVGFLIHIYSVGYMWEEGGFYRFFAYLNLFMFFMLTLVLAKQLPIDVHWVGRRRPRVVPVDRVLVH